MRGLLVVVVVAAGAGCVSSVIEGDDPRDVRVVQAADAAGVSPEGPDDGPAPDGRVADAQTPDEGAPPGPQQPFVPGPDPELFDCSGAEPPVRRSPVPLDCLLDRGCGAPMVVGHRGVGGVIGTIAPENSLAAIRAALVMGTDGVELDVRHTADDQLVLMHDDTVDRTTFGVGRVDALTLAQVTALALRPPSHPRTTGDFSCERAPTLAEALRLTRGRLFVDLDVKTTRTDLVVQAIAALDAYDTVFFSSGSLTKVLAARALDPRIRVQIRPDDVAAYEDAQARLVPQAEVVEIDSGALAALAPRIRAGGQTVFVNAFVEDAVALVRGGQVYLDLYGGGADILQSEFPPLVLDALDR